jgi:hypothetical protein
LKNRRTGEFAMARPNVRGAARLALALALALRLAAALGG